MTRSNPRRPARGKVSALVAVALSSLVVSLLAGCGGGSGQSAAVSAGHLVVTSGKAKGDVKKITWALPHGEPATLDPTQALDYSPALVVSNLCDPMLRYKADFSIGPNVVTAKQVDPDTLVLTLRKGVHFWDGKEATAEDVAFSLEYSRRPAAGTSFAYTNVKSIAVTGPDQVTVSFKRPDELFVKELAAATGYLMEKKFTEAAGDSFGTAEGGLMCSGPFELGSWKQGSEIELRRNDRYWNPEYKAHAEVVSLKFLNDSAALAQGLASGEVEGAYEVPAAIIPRLQQSGNGRVIFGPSLDYLELAPARPNGPLADVNLRKAIFKSLDRPAIAKAVYYGAAIPNYTLLASTSWDPEAEELWKQAYPPYEKENGYNIEEAKKLVESSSYEGEPVKLMTLAGDATQSQVAQLIQQQAKKIGVNLQIVPTQPAAYSEAGYTAAKRKGIDLYLASSFNGVKDPLEPIPFYVTPSYYNYTGYEDPKVTALIDKARETFDAAARSKLLIKAQAIYEKEALTGSLVDPYAITYLNDKLSGAITSSASMWSPSLATIGAAG